MIEFRGPMHIELKIGETDVKGGLENVLAVLVNLNVMFPY